MEPTIRVVTCPCCRKILYAFERDATKKKEAWEITKDSPAIQDDSEGHFMKCASCSRRVAVEKVTGSGIERWTVSTTQKCDRVIP
jgi:hypothetical protein